jgi:hypothetical protein
VHPGAVHVDHGTSVRTFDGGFFEGTWAGDASQPNATTVFGSGMNLIDGELIVVPPTHHLECVYFARLGGGLVVSNSLAGLLVASGSKLDPRANYSRVFLEAVRAVWLIDDPVGGLLHQSFLIPTTTEQITGWYVENLWVKADLSTAVGRRPREAPFDSFAQYKSRLTEATKSLFSHAVGYQPIVALSGGYDSGAVAAVSAAAGASRAIGFTTARPSATNIDDDDSGARTAAALGLAYEGFDRLAYLDRSDLADADVFATGMAGEDIAFLGLEKELRRTTFLNGYWGGMEFAFADRNGWTHVAPITTSGADFTEFRLRADFYNVPLPVFGAIRRLDAPSLLERSEMESFRIGGRYDRPIPRRLAEEAGVERGTFAVKKRASNVLPPRAGPSALTPAARESLVRFAAADAGSARWQPQRPFSRVERGLMRAAERAHVDPIARRLQRRQAELTHFEPRFGNLLFRWAVSVVSERYAEVARIY